MRKLADKIYKKNKKTKKNMVFLKRLDIKKNVWTGYNVATALLPALVID
jgi:hypothetical protein